MSLSANFPSTPPSLNLDFAGSERLDPRITFTRATTARYYDGVTTAKAEENLLLQSQTMATSPWIVVSSSTTGSKTAPDGTSTAIEISATSTNGRTQQLVTIVSGLTYTLSMFVRRVTGVGDVRLIIADSSGNSLFTTTMSLTADWQRFTVSGAPAVTSISCRVIVNTSGDEVEVWGAQLEQRDAVTAYTPTTTQPITNYIPVLLTAADGVARFDHNPTTGESLGLLVEEQRTNLLTYSEQFDNAAWTKTDSSITANTIVAPDGTLTGDKLVGDAGTGGRSVPQGEAITSGTSYTFSCYAKQGETNLVMLQMDGDIWQNAPSIERPRVWVDLSTGLITRTTRTIATSIQSVGNGWYRISVTATASSSLNTNFRIALVNSDQTTTYTGDGFSGIYIWGAQLEAAAFPTSYIPTVASTVTRNADAATMTGTNFSSWYRQDEGTVCGEYKGVNNVSGATRRLVEIGISGSTSNRLILGYSSILNTRFLVVVSTSTQADISDFSTTSASVAAAYKNNSFAVSTNGNAVQTDGVGTVPTVNAMAIGAQFNSGGNTEINGHIQRITYYPARLTNEQLVALTR